MELWQTNGTINLYSRKLALGLHYKFQSKMQVQITIPENQFQNF